ncbi:MAG: hypothetical protein M3383_05500 [Actinomycetota bacterium]|nr:hypothetical protein [Actinomycetota bacterium]
MPPDELSGPDLAGVVADATAVGLDHVVIGGFSVIFHGFIRATRDSDLIVPDGPEADAAVLRFSDRVEGLHMREDRAITEADLVGADTLRFRSRHGIVDLLRGGLPPLDFETVADRAEQADWNGQAVRVASLQSIVGFKRLARRPQDRVDLAELEAIHGELPIEPIPGLDN